MNMGDDKTRKLPVELEPDKRDTLPVGLYFESKYGGNKTEFVSVHTPSVGVSYGSGLNRKQRRIVEARSRKNKR